jgi:hypothetical protein
MVDVHMRMTVSEQVKLDTLAARARTTRSGLVRLIDAAAAEADADPGRTAHRVRAAGLAQ